VQNADTPDCPIGPDEIARAAARLAPWVHRTPVLTSRTLDGRCRAHVFLKCENLQRVGAFKFRGAVNAVLTLPEERGTLSKDALTYEITIAK